MSGPPTSHLRAEEGLRASELLSTSARVAGASFANFALIGLLTYAPVTFAMLVWPELTLPVQLATIVLAYFAQSLITHVTVDHLSGRPSSLAPALSASFATLPSVFAVGLLSNFALLVGLLVLIVPGVALAVIWLVAIQAATVERLGPIAALRRSAALTQGHRTPIFLALLGVLTAPLAVFACNFCIIAGWILVSTDGSPSAPVTTLQIGFRIVMQAVLLIGSSVFSTVVYVRARALREGLDADAVVDVFS